MYNRNFIGLILITVLSRFAYSQQIHTDLQEPLGNTKFIVKNDTAQDPLFEFSGALMSNMPFVKDDYPSGFTQTYLRFSFKRFIPQAPRKIGLHLFRNFFVQALYSANVDDLPMQYNLADSNLPNRTRFANKLDVFQYAHLSLTSMLNLLTIIPRSADGNYWKTHVYIDGLASYIRTDLSDSLTNSINTAGSWLLGGNIKGRFKNTSNTLKSFSIETSIQVFWINPVNSWANYNLNSQYMSRRQTSLANNINKRFTISQHPFFRMGILGMYEIGDRKGASSDSRGNTAFVNLQYTFNKPNSTQIYHSNFFQAQLGISINISDLLKNNSNASSSNKPESKN